MIQEIKTDNIPLLDGLVYYLKKLAISTVLKDEEKALKYETLESIKESDRYISCIEGRARFDLFNYDEDILKRTSLPQAMIPKCLEDKYNIPENIRKEALEIAKQNCIDNYVEKNNYYRSLNGLPDLDDDFIFLNRTYLNPEIEKSIDIRKPIHEMTTNEIELLYEYKIMERLFTKYPKKDYLHHLGYRKIPIYNARIANKFSLLYIQQDIPKEVMNRYKDKIERNRVYTLKTIYNDAFKLGSNYYDNFMQIFIIIQTIMDVLAEMPDMIIKREVFDIRMVKLIFESNCIDYFPEIPFKYQVAMVRNLNRLIKYKSTTKNIVDICSLFGFENVQVFKYYLLKHRKVDKKTKEFVFNTKKVLNKQTGKMEEVPDESKNYDLKFIKVPIEGICDDYIHDKTKYLDYDEVVEGDKYWNGDLPHEMVKQSIIDQEFNYLQSKYLSVDTIYSLTRLSFESIYFMNMLFDNVDLEEKLRLYIPCISSTANFKFVDVVCYLYALMYEFIDKGDDLMDTPTKIMYIKGFNFDADMIDLSNYIQQKGFTMKELGVDEFQIPENSVLSYNQLMDIFTKNANIYDHVVKQLYKADNKRIYDVYKKIYDSLMINEFSMDFFKKKDGTVAKTYTDFIHDRDLILYNNLISIRGITSKETKNDRITEQINSIVYILEEYIDTDKFKYIFSFLPSVSAEAIKKYIFKVVNFFKSYKMDIIGIGTIYKFDDRLENKIKMIDEVLFKYVFTREDTIEVISKLFNTVNLTKEDTIQMIDHIYMDITYWTSLFFNEGLNIKEEFVKNIVSSFKNDLSEVNDEKNNYIISKLNKESLLEYHDFVMNKSKLNKDDKIKMIDQLYMDITYWALVYCKEEKFIKDIISSNISINKEDTISIEDKINIKINNL